MERRAAAAMAEKELAEEGRADHDAYRQKLARRAARRNPVVFLLLGLFLAGALVSWLQGLGPEEIAVFGVAAAVSSMFFLHPSRWLSKGEYYAFRGSRLDNGKHRCVFCGGRGIYRRGEYKSDNRYAYCSKCESPLFAE